MSRLAAFNISAFRKMGTEKIKEEIKIIPAVKSRP
jgi:hypothetical protein